MVVGMEVSVARSLDAISSLTDDEDGGALELGPVPESGFQMGDICRRCNCDEAPLGVSDRSGPWAFQVESFDVVSASPVDNRSRRRHWN